MLLFGREGLTDGKMKQVTFLRNKYIVRNKKHPQFQETSEIIKYTIRVIVEYQTSEKNIVL